MSRTRCGNPRPSVQIACTVRGDKRPPLSDRMPAVALRVWVDLHVVDIGTLDCAEVWVRAALSHGERIMGFGHRIYMARVLEEVKPGRNLCSTPHPRVGGKP